MIYLMPLDQKRQNVRNMSAWHTRAAPEKLLASGLYREATDEEIATLNTHELIGKQVVVYMPESLGVRVGMVSAVYGGVAIIAMPRLTQFHGTTSVEIHTVEREVKGLTVWSEV